MKKPESVMFNMRTLFPAAEEDVWVEMTEPLSPMLAQQKVSSVANEKQAAIAQPKLDGVRAIYDPRWKQLFTRGGLQIECCDHIIKAIADAGLADTALDGEIYVHGMHFDAINRLLSNHETTAKTQELEYHIFDWMNWKPMIERVQTMRRWNLTAPLRLVETRMILTQAGIERYYENCLKNGYEGVMLRNVYSRYPMHGGRTTALRRIKPHKDTEATIIGFTKGTGKNAKTFGSLLLKMPNGIEFKCAGMDDETRVRLHQENPIGATVTFIHQGFTQNGTPRFPRYKGVRADMAA